MVLPIIKFPNPVLRKPTEPVTFPLSKEIQKLTKDMIDTVRNADGIGLAATQVGKSVNVVIINLEKSGIPLFPLYNMKILRRSFKKVEIEEGCLSVTGVFGTVKRPNKITIQARNGKGKTVKFADDGWIARVAQHEMDHINNILIIDKIRKYSQGAEIVSEWKKKKLL